MEQRNGELHAETDEARAGSTPNIVRWVLLVGLLLAIILLSATWMIGAASVDEQDRHQNVSRQIIDRNDGRGTDSVVSDGADELQNTAPSAESSSNPTAIEN